MSVDSLLTEQPDFIKKFNVSEAQLKVWKGEIDSYAKALMAAGGATSDVAYRKAVVQKVLYKTAAFISVGTKVFPPQTFGDLDVRYDFPSEMTAEWPVGETAIGMRQRIEWTPFRLTLEAAMVRLFISDQAVLRGTGNLQVQTSLRRASEALAKKKDENILDAISAGAGATGVTVPAGQEWNSNSAAVDIVGDIEEAWENILDESNVSVDDMRRTALIYPVKCHAKLRGLHMINNVQQRLSDYMTASSGIAFYPTRYYTDSAYLLVKGSETGTHGELQTTRIPLTERERVAGSGNEWIIRQFYNTKITPESALVSTSYRISKIDNVVA